MSDTAETVPEIRGGFPPIKPIEDAPPPAHIHVRNSEPTPRRSNNRQPVGTIGSANTADPARGRPTPSAASPGRTAKRDGYGFGTFHR